jgi:hypothetical protein
MKHNSMLLGKLPAMLAAFLLFTAHGSNSISPDPDLRRGPRPCGPAERNDAFSSIRWRTDYARYTWFGPH